MPASPQRRSKIVTNTKMPSHICETQLTNQEKGALVYDIQAPLFFGLAMASPHKKRPASPLSDLYYVTKSNTEPILGLDKRSYILSR